MNQYLKFFGIFLPLAAIMTFLAHSGGQYLAALAPEIMAKSGSTINVAGGIDWITAMMIGSAVALFITLLICRYFNPILVTILYFAVQTVCSAPLGLAMYLHWNENAVMKVTALVLILSSLLTILLLHICKFYNIRDAFFINIPWKSFLLCLVATVFGLFSANIFNEMLNLKDITGEVLGGMSLNPIGILAIAVIGPICEEIGFRGAICGGLIRKGVKPWTAIFISALIFGLVHGNPAQIPYAFIIGVIFAYIYWRTGSLIPSILLHIINNSVSCGLINLYGTDANDMQLSDMLGGIPTAYYWMVGAAVACVLLLMVFDRSLSRDKCLRPDR